LLALAQHYGIPTRFLDWTRHAYTAPYFAAIGAAEAFTKKSIDPATHLSVWALNTEALKLSRVTPPKVNQKVKVITVPSADNPNLNVQKGLFTIYQPPLRWDSSVDRTPFDHVIERYGVKAILIHFTLPVEKASKLIRLLFLEGVRGAPIYAGYKGAATATMEQVYWDKWDRPGDIWHRFSPITWTGTP